MNAAYLVLKLFWRKERTCAVVRSRLPASGTTPETEPQLLFFVHTVLADVTLARPHLNRLTTTATFVAGFSLKTKSKKYAVYLTTMALLA